MKFIFTIVAILIALKIAGLTEISWLAVLTPVALFLAILAIPVATLAVLIIYEAMKR